MGGFDFGHLRLLFGKVHVQWPVTAQFLVAGKILHGNCPEAVRCGADGTVGRQAAKHVRGSSVEFFETRHVVAETDLAIAERTLVAATILVVDRKKRQPDAGLTGRCRDAMRHLCQIIIWRAIGLMVEIVKLHIGGVARLEHFHLYQCGNRLDMIGRQPVEEAVHQLPPGPEGV